MVQIKHKQHFTGHRSAIYALTSGLTPGTFYSGGGDGWIVGWTLGQEDGRLLAQHTEPIITLSTCGELILAGTLSGQLLMMAPDQSLRKIVWHQKGLFRIIVHDEYLYTLGGDGRVTKWTKQGEPVETIHLSGQALRAGDLGDHGLLYIGASDGFIYAVRLPDLELVNSWPAHNPSVFSVIYHQGSLYSGGRDALLKRWDSVSGECLMQLPAHLYTINALVVANHYLISGSRDKTMKIWRIPDLELLKVIDIFKFEAHFRSVNNLLYFADEQVLLSAGDDRQMISWQLD